MQILQKQLFLLLVLLVVNASCGDDPSTMPDASIPDVTPDATTPDATPTTCQPSPMANLECWDYDGVTDIGDMTCRHQWSFRIDQPSCTFQTGWELVDDTYTTNNEGAALTIIRPKELQEYIAAFEVTIHGGENTFDPSSECGETFECTTSTPETPGECFCSLLTSRLDVTLSDPTGSYTRSATSLPDGSEVNHRFACCYPDAQWTYATFTTTGSGGLTREIKDIKIDVRTNYDASPSENGNSLNSLSGS